MRSQKGFTLFTALISLLLVSISLALIFNMINTEETYLSLIQDQSSTSDLMTVADIARADAFNTFIITLRSTWEEYKSSTPFYITRKQTDMNWDYFVEDFVKNNFFERKFAGYFANGLLHNLEYSQNPPGYNIYIQEKTWTWVDSSGNPCTTPDHSGCSPLDLDDTNAFDVMVEKMFNDGGQKVDVVGCEQTDENCNGSFYLTLDTTKLDDADYELLPVVTVLKYKTNQAIQRPVLSRQIYKIYMPWRGFQAFRVARNIAHNNETEQSDNPATNPGDTGLFSPEIHNTLEQARLGFCDPGYCAPRTNFFATPSSTGVEQLCTTIANETISPSLPPVFGVDLPNTNYNVQDNSLNVPFKNLYVTILQENLRERSNETIIYNNGLEMQEEPIYPGSEIKVSEVYVSTDKKQTKILSESPAGHSTTVASSAFDNLDKINSISGGFGLFWNGNKPGLLWDYSEDTSINDWYNTNRVLEVVDNTSGTGDTGTGSLQPLSCSELDSAGMLLEFKETDPRYKVKDEYLHTDTKIQIKLEDAYTPFYFQPANTGWPLTVTNSPENYIALPSSLPTITLNTDQYWKCQSYSVGGDTSCAPSN